MVPKGCQFSPSLRVYLCSFGTPKGRCWYYIHLPPEFKHEICIEIDPNVIFSGFETSAARGNLDPSLTCKRQHQLLTYIHRLSCFNLPNLQRENVGTLGEVLSSTCNTMYQLVHKRKYGEMVREQNFILQGHPHFSFEISHAPKQKAKRPSTRWENKKPFGPFIGAPFSPHFTPFLPPGWPFVFWPKRFRVASSDCGTSPSVG